VELQALGALQRFAQVAHKTHKSRAKQHWLNGTAKVIAGNKAKRYRAGNELDFPGRQVPQQKFSIASFPGIYEKEWLNLTKGEDYALEMGDATCEQQMDTSCVFYPNTGKGTNLWAVHPRVCSCKKLYGSFPMFKEWSDGKAPWGCAW
jgi:hypothetical protein